MSTREEKIQEFMSALNDYVDARIAYKTTDQEMDSMGSYHEEKRLRLAVEDLTHVSRA